MMIFAVWQRFGLRASLFSDAFCDGEVRPRSGETGMVRPRSGTGLRDCSGRVMVEVLRPHSGRPAALNRVTYEHFSPRNEWSKIS